MAAICQLHVSGEPPCIAKTHGCLSSFSSLVQPAPSQHPPVPKPAPLPSAHARFRTDRRPRPRGWRRRDRWNQNSSCCCYLVSGIDRPAPPQEVGVTFASLRQPAKNLVVTSLRHVWCASRPVETGTPSASTSPPAPVSAACAPLKRRSVALCSPPSSDEKRTS